MLIAAYFGESEISWASDEQRTFGLISSIMIIQLVAVAGAMLTARASRSFGNISTLIVINALWLLICIYAYYVRTPIQFYIAAGLVGMVMGGIQALSRSTYAKLLPETTDTTSFFSFYDVTEKIGIVIGMSIFGIVSQLGDSMRPAALLLGVFFGLGIVLLLRVPKRKP
jgi:UMF1 family MFS transporter